MCLLDAERLDSKICDCEHATVCFLFPRKHVQFDLMQIRSRRIEQGLLCFSRIMTGRNTTALQPEHCSLDVVIVNFFLLSIKLTHWELNQPIV